MNKNAKSLVGGLQFGDLFFTILLKDGARIHPPLYGYLSSEINSPPIFVGRAVFVSQCIYPDHNCLLAVVDDATEPRLWPIHHDLVFGGWECARNWINERLLTNPRNQPQERNNV